MPDQPDTSVAGNEPTAAASQPAPGHPLGSPNLATVDANLLSEPSVIDVVLDLDEVLSADVRRTELPARFATRGDLYGVIALLQAELDGLTDEVGNPLKDPETPVSGSGEPTGRTAEQVALEIRQAQQELAASFRTVWMLELIADDWDEFQARHRKVLDAGSPYPESFWEDLIVRTAARPAITAKQLKQLRQKFGHPAIDELGKTAWEANTQGGVSIPKSQLSSHVLRRAARGQS